MVGVTLLVAGGSLEPRQSSSITSTPSVVQDFRTRQLTSSDSVITSSDTVPIRRGSRFESDAVEVQKAWGALRF